MTISGSVMATDQMSLLYDEAVRNLTSNPTDESPYFWQRFTQSFKTRVPEVYTDNFSPFAGLSWLLKKPDASWQDYMDRGTSTAQSSMSKSLEYSLRDASLTLPIGAWVDDNQDSINDLFVNSVDAVEEESVSPLNPNYIPNERRWWKSISEARTLRYGVRPLNSSPYAFLSFRVADSDRPILLGHVRYYCRDFTDHRFQLAVSLPLTERVALDVGTAYQFGQHEQEKKVVVKLSKALAHGGIAHVGMELQKTPVLIAGITLPL